MEPYLTSIYDAYNASNIYQGKPLQSLRGNHATPSVTYNEAQNIASGLMALANYTMASANIQAPKTRNVSEGGTDNEIISEALRLKKHPKLVEYDRLFNRAKFAVVVNNSGRLMVDGNLYDGVVKINSEEETKYVEYKLGNPITVLSEYENPDEKGKPVLKLTTYEYCKITPYVTKTEKSLIYENNWDNPESVPHLTVPTEIQEHAGITKENNVIKSY